MEFIQYMFKICLICNKVRYTDNIYCNCNKTSNTNNPLKSNKLINYSDYLNNIKEIEEDPLPGVQYQITGGPGEKCLSNGYSWKDSKLTTNKKKGN